MAKDSIFLQKSSLQIKGRLISLERPLVMGILNVTPDSFYDGGKFLDKENALQQCTQMLEEGADIIDIGGMSTRPGSERISDNEELRRIIPIVELISKTHPDAIISLDTYHGKTAKEGLETGAHIINDVSGGSMDDSLFEVLEQYRPPYILTHIQGTPKDMQDNPHYDQLMVELIKYFSEKRRQLTKIGVNDIIIDPGFGFGKTVEHNYDILHNLKSLKIMDLPVLVGLSRKSMLYKPIESVPENSLEATVAANTLALVQGADILRVHDVKAAVDTIKIVNLSQNS